MGFECLEVGRGATKRAIIGFDGGAELLRTGFFDGRAGVPIGLAQAGVGGLLADLEEWSGQAAEASVLVELCLHSGGSRGRQGAEGALAIDVADAQEAGAVAGTVLWVAATGGSAALHEAMDEGAGRMSPISARSARVLSRRCSGVAMSGVAGMVPPSLIRIS